MLTPEQLKAVTDVLLTLANCESYGEETVLKACELLLHFHATIAAAYANHAAVQYSSIFGATKL